jgi:hypothetical protein
MFIKSRVLTLSVGLTMTLLLFAVFPTQVVTIHYRWIVAGVLAVVLVVVAIWLRRTPVARELLVPPMLGDKRGGLPPANTAAPVSEDFIQYAQKRFARTYGIETLIHLIAMMVEPRGHTSRITEHFSLSEDVIRLTTTRTVSSSARDDVLIPAVRARKGDLVDNFRVNFEGHNVSTLSYVESQGAILSAVQTFFYQMFPAELYPVQTLRENALRRCLFTCGAESAVGSTDRQELTNALRCLISSGSEGPSPYTSVLLELVEALQDNYYLIAAVKSDNCTRKKMVTELTQRRKDFGSGLGPQLRKFLGLPRREFHIDIPASGETASYHANFEIPEDTYLYDRRIWIVNMLDRADLVEVCEVDRFEIPEVATADAKTSQLGMGYLHVYTRNPLLFISDGTNTRSAQRQYIAQVSGAYRERPPGSLAVVLPVSFFLRVLTWGIGHFFSSAFPLHGGSTVVARATARGNQIILNEAPNSAWPAVILGIPALVSGWVLARLTREYIQRMSLATLLLILWMVTNAGAAVALAALKNANQGTTTWNPVNGLTVTHVSWAVLMLSTGLNFMLMFVALCVRTRRYWQLVTT